MSPTPTGYGDIFPTSPCHLRPVATATLQLCASRSTLWNSLLLFYLYLRSLQLQEHHDISVTDYGDTLSERSEETPSLPADYHGTYPNWLCRHFPCPLHMELGMATVALCDLRISFSAFASLTSLVTLQGVHCRYPLPRSLSTSAPPSSTGAPCHFRPVAIEIVPGASRSTDYTTFTDETMRSLPLRSLSLTKPLPLRSCTLTRLKGLPLRSCSLTKPYR